MNHIRSPKGLFSIPFDFHRAVLEQVQNVIRFKQYSIFLLNRKTYINCIKPYIFPESCVKQTTLMSDSYGELRYRFTTIYLTQFCGLLQWSDDCSLIPKT